MRLISGWVHVRNIRGVFDLLIGAEYDRLEDNDLRPFETAAEARKSGEDVKRLELTIAESEEEAVTLDQKHLIVIAKERNRTGGSNEHIYQFYGQWIPEQSRTFPGALLSENGYRPFELVEDAWRTKSEANRQLGSQTYLAEFRLTT